jgi:hypothetical protein
MTPIEEAIVKKLGECGPCFLDEVVTHLSSFSSGEVSLALDRMVREGRVLLRQRGYSAYQVSLGSHVSSPIQHRALKKDL